MSDFLRVSCSAKMNEDAKCAVESFAVHLRTVLEQYQSLWEHYVQLNDKYDELKHSTDNTNAKQHTGEHVDSKTVCKEATTKCAVDPLSEWLESKTKEQTSTFLQDEESDSINEHMLRTSISDLESDMEYNISEESKELAKELQTEMFTRSPIFAKGRTRPKKSKNIVKRCNLNKLIVNLSTSVNNNSAETCASDKTSEKTFHENEIPATSTQMQKNVNNQSSGLGFTLSRNVDTSFLQSGKKLKQTKLILSSPKKNLDVTFFDASDDEGGPSCASVQTAFAQYPNSSLTESPKASKDSAYRQHVPDICTLETQDIIESSPGPGSLSSRFKNRLMLKRKMLSYCQQRTVASDSKKENIYPSTSDIQSSARLSTPLRERTSYNVNTERPLSLVRKSQKANDVSTTGNISEEYGTMNSDGCGEKSKISRSPILVHFDDTYTDTPINLPAQETEGKSTVMSTPDSTKQGTIPIHDPALEDDTFFEPEEERLKNTKPNDEPSETDQKRNTSTEQMLPPPKRIQLDSCNTSHQRRDKSSKYVYKTGPVRNKIDRGKLNGWSCWECKEYYGDLGLSEKELAMRKKQCSRHRAKFDEWQSTPEGFWNPVFPDTISSSFEDH